MSRVDNIDIPTYDHDDDQVDAQYSNISAVLSNTSPSETPSLELGVYAGDPPPYTTFGSLSRVAGAGELTASYDIIIAAEAVVEQLKEEISPQSIKCCVRFVGLFSQNNDGDQQSSTTNANVSQEIYIDHHNIIDDDDDDGQYGQRQIGEKLVFIPNRCIAIGSNGTLICEGSYEGRPVAVKRLLRTHHAVAFEEIQNLKESDDHQNIVRYYGVERDRDFVYIALQRCTCNLDDLVQICDPYEYQDVNAKDHSVRPLTVYQADRLEPLKHILGDVKLSQDKNGRPLPLLLELMRDIVSGLVHLHALGIIHRDLKPQNVLILKGRGCLCAKLSDMGISKRLQENMTSLSHHSTGCGTSGWQAPERLRHGRQTLAVDMFSLGCVLFFCITGGNHPFGSDHFERDANIVNNKVDLFLLKDFPEADHLISLLLSPNPKLRPKAIEVLHHPLLWDSLKRLLFLCDTSNRVSSGEYPDLLKELEAAGPKVIGSKWHRKITWNKYLDNKIITHVSIFRNYNFGSVRDLLRLIRNMFNHYEELPIDIKDIVGPTRDDLDGYFTSQFPKLFMEVYKVMCISCKEDQCFKDYFQSNV